MPVWPFLVAFCIACLVWAVRRDEETAVALGIMLCAYCITRAVVTAAPDARLDIPLALIWLGAARAVATYTQLRVFPHCINIMGLFYFVAYLLKAPREFGSWPYVAIDVLAVGAMAWAAWNAGNGGGNRVLGSDRAGNRRVSDRGGGVVARKEAPRVEVSQ